ncbi:FMN-dependent NADH-azoreductase [Chitinophaga sp. Hz27]|uniref:FMN-dependent NADH-azoreductase n=1 Tax=Chitinophaga sp. Hz27 TaxID=3347169 RepID=UPI0035D5ACB4
MKNIFHISSSPSGEASNSILLANRIISSLQEKYPDSKVTHNDTVKKKYGHIDGVLQSAYFTPPSERTSLQLEALQDSDEAVTQLEMADIIVISVATHNFGIPSALKSWIDHIVRAGRTFSYGSGMPEGLLDSKKKVYLAIASKGVFSEGPLKAMDFTEPYLRVVLPFIGLTDITTYRIEGAGIPGLMDTAVEKGLQQAEMV